IPRVWASPFTARAFAWRQALMREPEHVYPAVLLLASVDADKSGVLVTQDIDSGDRGWISVAVNEGVGGAVDGQSAESLRIHLASGRVRLMAQASAPWRRQLNPAGGITTLPASGADAVLTPAEIAHLVAFARELPQRFPAIVDAAGQPAPADVEFGFEDGALRLFQIRPFLDNAAARANRYLLDMDPAPATLADRTVALDGVPD
ncbi:MAG: PEP/pyruvate-binding domain-containing protein, partial [Gammaproteobacteria bacterium]